MKWSRQDLAGLLGAALVVALSVQVVRLKARNAALEASVVAGVRALPTAAPLPNLPLRLASGDTSRLTRMCTRGHPVVLVFSSNECAACKKLDPALASLARRRPGVRVLVVGPNEIPAAESPGVVRAMAPAARVRETLRISIVPTVLASDAECRISGAGTGLVASRYLVESLLADARL